MPIRLVFARAAAGLDAGDGRSDSAADGDMTAMPDSCPHHQTHACAPVCCVLKARRHCWSTVVPAGVRLKFRFDGVSVLAETRRA